MAESDVGQRDDRGNWWPFKLVTTPPLFVWPPRPTGLLRWLFGWPGYLWPWNTVYLAIAVATWLWLTPDLATMETLAPGWIAFLLARNAVLVGLVTGAWHLRLYWLKTQGTSYKYNLRWPSTDDPNFLFGNQTAENVFWTYISAVPVWTAFEVVTLWGMANGIFPYLDIAAHPIQAGLLVIGVLLFRELHFYLIHRLIHWPPLYRSVHRLHHKNVNPGPWSGMSMHPVEHVLYFSGVLLHWIVASHPIHVIFHLQHLAFAPAQGHSGFERVIIRDRAAVQTGDFFHYLHHKYFECNYGGDGTIPIDKWFGTFHDGSPESRDKMIKRLQARRAAARQARS